MLNPMLGILLPRSGLVQLRLMSLSRDPVKPLIPALCAISPQVGTIESGIFHTLSLSTNLYLMLGAGLCLNRLYGSPVPGQCAFILSELFHREFTDFLSNLPALLWHSRIEMLRMFYICWWVGVREICVGSEEG
jgi:hypothetical protein